MVGCLEALEVGVIFEGVREGDGVGCKEGVSLGVGLGVGVAEIEVGEAAAVVVVVLVVVRV